MNDAEKLAILKELIGQRPRAIRPGEFTVRDYQNMVRDMNTAALPRSTAYLELMRRVNVGELETEFPILHGKRWVRVFWRADGKLKKSTAQEKEEGDE